MRRSCIGGGYNNYGLLYLISVYIAIAESASGNGQKVPPEYASALLVNRTACRGYTVSKVAFWGHGAFTYSIVQQLAGRNAAHGGIGMLQLSGNVSNDMVRITQDRQHPKPYYQGYHDFFVVE